MPTNTRKLPRLLSGEGANLQLSDHDESKHLPLRSFSGREGARHVHARRIASNFSAEAPADHWRSSARLPAAARATPARTRAAGVRRHTWHDGNRRPFVERPGGNARVGSVPVVFELQCDTKVTGRSSHQFDVDASTLWYWISRLTIQLELERASRAISTACTVLEFPTAPTPGAQN